MGENWKELAMENSNSKSVANFIIKELNMKCEFISQIFSTDWMS